MIWQRADNALVIWLAAPLSIYSPLIYPLEFSLFFSFVFTHSEHLHQIVRMRACCWSCCCASRIPYLGSQRNQWWVLCMPNISFLHPHPSADVGDTALHAACYHGHIDTVIFLLDQPTVKVDFESMRWLWVCCFLNDYYLGVCEISENYFAPISLGLPFVISSCIRATVKCFLENKKVELPSPCPSSTPL